ncbi:MAG: PAS domain-containing protein [Spirochaetota bacterium]
MSISDISREPTFVDCNKAFSRISGYSRHELVGLPSAGFSLFVDTSLRSSIIEILKAGGQVDSVPTLLRRKDGSEVPVTLSILWVEIDRRIYSITSFVPVSGPGA